METSEVRVAGNRNPEGAQYAPVVELPPMQSWHVAASSYAVGVALDRIAYGSLCALAFALPWETSTGPRWVVWLGALAFGLTLLRIAALPQVRRLSDLHYFMLAFVLWSGTSVLWTLDLNSTAARVGTYFQSLALAWVVWVLAASESRVVGLLQSFVFGTYIFSIGTISNAITGHPWAFQPDDVIDMNGYRYAMSGSNPNATGTLLAPSIPMALYLLARRNRNPALALSCWLQLVLCVTTILLSGSRGALLAAVPTILMFPSIMGRLPKWHRVIALMAAVAAIACGASLVPPNTWKRIFELGTEITEGTMTHRTEIWKGSLELFREHPVLGVGAAAHAQAVVKIIGQAYVAHNTFLSVLAELGVVGILLLLGLLAVAFNCACRMRGSARPLWVLTLAACTISAFDTTTEYQKVTWFILALLAAHAYVRRDTGRRVATGT